MTKKFEFQALALVGYNNTPSTCVGIKDITSYDMAMLGYATEGETPRTAGAHYMGSSGRHYFPSDVIILIPDENGMVEHGYDAVTHKPAKVPIEVVWNKYSEEERETMENEDGYWYCTIDGWAYRGSFNQGKPNLEYRANGCWLSLTPNMSQYNAVKAKLEL
jgi:hypothetical protein